MKGQRPAVSSISGLLPGLSRGRSETVYVLCSDVAVSSTLHEAPPSSSATSFPNLRDLELDHCSGTEHVLAIHGSPHNIRTVELNFRATLVILTSGVELQDPELNMASVPSPKAWMAVVWV